MFMCSSGRKIDKNNSCKHTWLLMAGSNKWNWKKNEHFCRTFFSPALNKQNANAPISRRKISPRCTALRKILYRTAGGKRETSCVEQGYTIRAALLSLYLFTTTSLLNKFVKMVLTFQKFLGKALPGRCPLFPPSGSSLFSGNINKLLW